MEKKMHHQLAFIQGAVSAEDTKKYLKLLNEETLDKISHISFDRRLIKPIMEAAWSEAQKENSEDFNSIVQNMINNKNEMFQYMCRYCINKKE